MDCLYVSVYTKKNGKGEHPDLRRITRRGTGVHIIVPDPDRRIVEDRRYVEPQSIEKEITPPEQPRKPAPAAQWATWSFAAGFLLAMILRLRRKS
jgi:hypothetical protein